MPKSDSLLSSINYTYNSFLLLFAKLYLKREILVETLWLCSLRKPGTSIRKQFSVRDLRTIDVCTVHILEILKDPGKKDLTPGNFSHVYEEKFVRKDLNEIEIVLIEGGRNIQVGFENCGE